MTEIEAKLRGKRDALLERRKHLLECLRGVRGQIKEVDSQLSDCAAAARALEIAWDHEPPKPICSVKDALIGCLGAAGLSGSTVKEMVPIVERELNCNLHPKTCGMTLFRMKREGLVDRKPRSHIWYLQKFVNGQ